MGGVVTTSWWVVLWLPAGGWCWADHLVRGGVGLTSWWVVLGWSAGGWCRTDQLVGGVGLTSWWVVLGWSTGGWCWADQLEGCVGLTRRAVFVLWIIIRPVVWFPATLWALRLTFDQISVFLNVEARSHIIIVSAVDDLKVPRWHLKLRVVDTRVTRTSQRLIVSKPF